MAIGALSDVSPNEAIDAVGVEDALPEDPQSTDEVEDALTGAGEDEAVEDAPAEDEQEEAAEGEQETEPEAKKPEAETPGAQKRIRQLVEEKNGLVDELRASRVESARQFQALQARFEQQAAAARQAQEYSAQLQQEQLRIAHERREAESYAKMSLVEQLKYDANRQSRSEFEAELQRRDEAVRHEFARRDQQANQREEQFKRSQRLARLESESNSAINDVLFKDLDRVDIGDASEDLHDFFLAYAGGKGEYPKDAAPKFRKVLERFAFAINKSKARTSKVQAGQKVPSVSGRSAKSPSAAGAKQGRMSPAERQKRWEDLQQRGMDFIDDTADRLMRGE